MALKGPNLGFEEKIRKIKNEGDPLRYLDNWWPDVAGSHGCVDSRSF